MSNNFSSFKPVSHFVLCVGGFFTFFYFFVAQFKVSTSDLQLFQYLYFPLILFHLANGLLRLCTSLLCIVVIWTIYLFFATVFIFME